MSIVDCNGGDLGNCRASSPAKTMKPMEKHIPNIFSFATSELSQDAMFAWLISWSAPDYTAAEPELHRIGQNFVRLLAGKDSDFKIDSVDVGRQWENIDIWAEINDNTFLIVEDKTGTSIHDDQLERYKASVEKEYAGKRTDLCYAYVKTAEEPGSVLKSIEQCGFRTINRAAILKCLEDYRGSDSLLVSYREHLRMIDASVNSFRSLPEKGWSWDAWQGFYKELESRVDLDSWNYVANPAGGFLGAWWHFVEMQDGAEMYLQFEQGKLCFKISYEGDENCSEVRYRHHTRLLQLARDRYPEIRRPDRFGCGTYMTIAVVDEDKLFGEGPVDFDALFARLKEYEVLIDELRCNK